MHEPTREAPNPVGWYHPVTSPGDGRPPDPEPPTRDDNGAEVTLETLVNHRMALVAAGKLQKNICSNERSALNLFCIYLRLSMQARVDPLLTSGFEANLAKFERIAANPPPGIKQVGKGAFRPTPAVSGR